MTWTEFKSQVRVFLHVHGRRQGIQDLIDQLIESGFRSLQRAVKSARVVSRDEIPVPLSGSTVFTEIPAPRAARIIRIFSQDPDTGAPSREYREVSDLDAVTSGAFEYDACGYARDEDTLYVFPALHLDQRPLVVQFENVSSAFEDTDEVYAPEGAAECVAQYVLMNLVLTVDNDIQTASVHQKLHNSQRAALKAAENIASISPS